MDWCCLLQMRKHNRKYQISSPKYRKPVQFEFELFARPSKYT